MSSPAGPYLTGSHGGNLRRPESERKRLAALPGSVSYERTPSHTIPWMGFELSRRLVSAPCVSHDARLVDHVPVAFRDYSWPERSRQPTGRLQLTSAAAGSADIPRQHLAVPHPGPIGEPKL